MSEDTDYHDLLDENVDEAEEKIKDLEDPDYEERQKKTEETVKP